MKPYGWLNTLTYLLNEQPRLLISKIPDFYKKYHLKTHVTPSKNQTHCARLPSLKTPLGAEVTSHKKSNKVLPQLPLH